MVTRVKGGIINDQMLKGKLRFFKIVGPTDAFEYTVGTDTVGDGTGTPDVVVPNTTSFINEADSVTYVEKVGIKQPSPNSVAEYTLRAILEKCTISMIRVINNDVIHIAIENTDNGWDTTSEGPFDFDTGLSTDSDAADNIEAALALIGTVDEVPDTTDTGKSFAFDTVGDGTGTSVISVTEVAFQLA